MKKKSYRNLKNKLDKVFSIYIRQRDKGRCFTCGIKKNIKELDCGHYIKRQHLATRWLEENCAAQCWSCNRFRDGNKERYAVELEKKYGHGILQKLEQIKNKGRKFKVAELEELIKKYAKRNLST